MAPPTPRVEEATNPKKPVRKKMKSQMGSSPKIEISQSQYKYKHTDKVEPRQVVYSEMLSYDMQYFKFDRGTLLDCWYGMFL